MTTELRLLLVTLVAAAFAMLGMPAVASASWSTPMTTGASDVVGTYQGDVALATDGAGHVTAVGGYTAVYVSTLSPVTHTWSARQTIQAYDSATVFSEFQMAENSAGDIIVAWRRSKVAGNGGVSAAIYRASSNAWSVQNIESNNSTNVPVLHGVAIDAAGNAFITWSSFHEGYAYNRGHVKRYARSSNTWGATVDFPDVVEFYGDIAIIGASDALLVTSREAGGTLPEIAWRRYSSATNSWSSSQDITTPGTRQLRLASNSSGNAILAWRTGTDIFTATYTGSSNTWSAPATIASTQIGPGRPNVALASDDSSVVAWSDPGNAPSKIRGAVFDTATGWTVSDLSPSGTVSDLALAGNANGDVIAGWKTFTSVPVTDADMTVRRFSSLTDTWGSVEVLAGPGLNHMPRVAIDTDGGASAVFYSQAGDSSNGLYWAQELPPTVSSFSRVTSTPTNLASVQFSVTFSESVTGLTTSDFTTRGSATGWTISGLSGSGAGPYTVTANGSSGTDGTVSVSLAANSVTGSAMLAPTAAETSPTITVDRVAPSAPTITSSPSSPTKSTSASVSFTGAEGGGSFQCKLDSGSYATCTSPYTTSGLGEGPHTVYTRQVDASGNASLSASTTWTVDTTAPLAPGLSGAPTGSVSTTSASITITPAEAGGTLKCKVDSGTFATCTSPYSLSGLSQDSHTVVVRQDDAAGNTGATASATWIVDTIAPSAPGLAGVPSGSTSVTSVSIAISGAEPGGTFSCNLDSSSWSTCTSPFTASSLADAPHSLQVRQLDAALNAGAITTVSWTVDTTGPDAPSLSNLPAASTTSTSVAIGITGAEAGGTYQCKIDGETYDTCTSPYRRSSLTDSAHTVMIRQVDDAGNAGTPTSYTWTIVHLTLSVPSQPTGVEATATGMTTARVTFTEPDDNGGSAIISYTVRCVSSSGGGTRSATTASLTVEMTGLSAGHTYSCTVAATNSTGTSAVSVASRAFTLASPAEPVTAPSQGVGSSSGSPPAALPPVKNLAATISGATAIRLTLTSTTKGATHSATCTAAGGKSSSAKSTTGTLQVRGLTYGKSYLCDVIASLGTRTSSSSTVRITLLADLPAPSRVKAPKSATPGSSVSVAWKAGEIDDWAAVSQSAQLRTASGVIVASATPRARSSALTALLKIPASAAAGSYSLCVVLQDSRSSDNREQACKKMIVTRPSGGGGSGSSGSGGGSKPKPVGPIGL